MKKITRWLVLLIVCAMVAATSCGRRHSADSFASSLDSVFLSLFPDPAEPGAIVLVAKGDSIIYDRGFGMADLKQGKAICDTTLFNICSISKQYAAMALGCGSRSLALSSLMTM